MYGPTANALAEAEAQTMRAIYRGQAEDRCVEEYLALEDGHPRRRYLNLVLAFLSWTEARVAA